VSLSFAADNSVTAILASTSSDGGATWSSPVTITRNATLPSGGFNDKELVTADPGKPGTAYAVWDQSNFPSDRASLGGLSHSFAFRGTPMFSKTVDGGLTWSTPQPMSSQNIASIGNQIVVEPDGTLIDGFLYSKGSGFDQPNQTLEGIKRSTDGGAHWSSPIQVTTT
jgi:Neuraminidase (sialidase)